MYIGMRDILAKDVDEQRAKWLAQITSLRPATVSARLGRASPRDTLATIFADHWPDDAEALRTLTVAVARDAGLESEIAAHTGLSHPQIRRRLIYANGSTRLGKVFPALAGGDDEDVAGEFELPLGAARAQAVRDTPLVAWLAERTGWSKAKVQRRLADAHGGTYVRTVLAEVWPIDEGDEWEVREILGSLTVGDVSASDQLARWMLEHTREPFGSFAWRPGTTEESTVAEALGDSWPVRTATVRTATRAPTTRGARAAAPSADLVNGRWKLERELGRGGFGAAWLATDTHIDEKVVLKFSTDTEGVESLRHELKVAFELNHPNICAYRDIGRDPARGTFIVTQFGGDSLHGIIRERGAHDVDSALAIARQVAAGLDHAHELDVSHLDVKPANIVVDARRRTMRVRLVDFGIAAMMRRTRRVDGGSTRVGSVVGYTPGYAAPEQLWGEARCSSDQYSLAAVFCSLLEGRVFTAPHKPPRYRALSRDANAALQRVLEGTVPDRFPSCAAFVAALEGR